MKTLSRILFAAALLSTATGCDDFLDINQNPNAFTPESVTPDVVLAQALNTTASLYTGGVGGATNAQNFNSYSSWAAGYWTKTNTINGYTEEQTFNYTTSFYANLFNLTYDNLNDYNIIQINGAAAYPNHAAIARIMKAYDFLLLVDQYGDIPYTQALLGATNVTPTYDKAQDIYKDLLVQLTGAIADITATPSNARTVGAEDIVFGGDMTRWKQFANSLKLRILLRESQTGNAAIDADVRTQLQALQTAADGFITTDVVAQPGYSQNLNQQNPLYNRYAYTQAGVGATERNYQIPTQYILDQYRTNNDPRLSQLYTMGSTLAVAGGMPTSGYIGGVLGEGTPPATGAATVNTRQASRFRGQETTTPGTATPGGIFKGFNQATPLMLLSEHLFNKAEAETRGLFTGGNAAAKVDFNNGILASFLYFYRTAAAAPAAIPADVTTSALAGVSQYNTFIATTAPGGSNAANQLVNFDVAATNGALGKQPIIIYQKYLAMNSIASTEAWDDFRRTGLPKIPLSPQATKFATRLLYPLSEASTNSANVPQGVDQFTKIFWDVVD
ncbi:SusD/RagB family nutrient-binding outer membrane lipoprotein [Hymenobacter sp.]|jgi:hypothetical protein|uniref:SusD/RagB family nutrient-binding outer membrane lipoprotein n=1 Tax=Hymenobacter sp. TaxID=1898978 RepID=UPI002ED91A4C